MKAPIVLFAIVAAWGSAGAVVIDFDSYPDGTPAIEGTAITDQWASRGVIFTGNAYVEDSSGASGQLVNFTRPNVMSFQITVPGPGAGFGCIVDLVAEFPDTNVETVHVDGFTLNGAGSGSVELIARDKDGVEIDSDIYFATAPFQVKSFPLDVEGEKIRSVELILDSEGTCLAVDNFEFDGSAVPVPAVGLPGLAVTIVVLLALAALRKKPV